jgi:hypothetical protein
MDPQAALQMLDQLGINVSDLPQIMQAAKAIAASGAQSAPLSPDQKQAMGIPLNSGGEGSVLGGRPGANNEIPNQPAGNEEARMMREIFSSDRNRHAYP